MESPREAFDSTRRGNKRGKEPNGAQARVSA